MQPYFFPYLGYLSLAKQVDRFILLDEVQFIRHGWIERNRILKPGDGWQYVNIPLKKHSRDTPIRKVEIDPTKDWRPRLLAQLQHYSKFAPYYRPTIAFLKELLDETYGDGLVEINRKSLQKTLEYVGIKKEMEVFSRLNLEIQPPSAPDEWALHICNALGGVCEYWNPIGGIDFFDRTKYAQAGISISFQKMNFPEYNQRRNVFEPGLSIIDVLMFNSKEEVMHMLDCYELV